MAIQTRREGETAVVAVGGKLDTVTSPEFLHAMGDVLASGTKRAVIDFADLTYVSSAGLGALVTVAKQFTAQGGEVRVANVQGSVVRIFDVCGIPKVVRVHGSVAEALAAGA